MLRDDCKLISSEAENVRDIAFYLLSLTLGEHFRVAELHPAAGLCSC